MPTVATSVGPEPASAAGKLGVWNAPSYQSFIA